MQSWHWIVSFPTASAMLGEDLFIIHLKYICTKTSQPDTDEASKIGYKYTKIISVNESTDMSRPSGGLVKSFKRNAYCISRCNGSL